MMSAFTGPLHFFRAFVSRINQGLNMGFSHLAGLRFVGLLPGFVIDNIRLIPVDILIQSCQLGAWRFLRDIVPQQCQFRQGIVGVATMPTTCLVWTPMPGNEPRNVASPKVKKPPSAPTR